MQAETLRNGGAGGSGFGWVVGLGFGFGFSDVSGEGGRLLRVVFIELLVLGCWLVCMFSREDVGDGSFSIVWDLDYGLN